jgi:acyl-CoA thioester hydrolase
MDDYRFKLDFEVRDYECDLSGIVNNAVYQHYLEHARHKYLKSRGLDFAALEEQGITLVVVRIEMDFLWPLRSGDKFTVGVSSERYSRLRFVFWQEIYRLPDEKAILNAKVIATALNAKGKPRIQAEVQDLLVSGLEMDHSG